jgi:ubiquinone/menaquinone biosynthesis C-methylase UbiE
METDLLSDRYTGSAAEEYDARRGTVAKWQLEQDIMAHVLGRFSRGTTVLDVPVGTGRFLKLYREYGLRATGYDVSVDMLEQCEKKAKEHKYDMSLVRGSIFDLGLSDGCFEVLVCIRFLNWIGFEDLMRVVAELSRVTRGYMILGLRHMVPREELGFVRFIRQIYMRLRGRLAKKGLVYHEKAEILTAFKKNELKIEEQHCVEERRDGTEYNFYVLKVVGSGQADRDG